MLWSVRRLVDLVPDAVRAARDAAELQTLCLPMMILTFNTADKG